MNLVITLKIEGLENDIQAGVSMVSDIEFTSADVKKTVDKLADIICLPEFRKGGN